MAERLSLQERIERERVRQRKSEERLKKLTNQASAKDRALDTRRKIVLGAVILDEAVTGNRMAEQVIDAAIRKLNRKRDQEAFNGWDWRSLRASAEQPPVVRTESPLESAGGS